jgi:hypothetical protein
MGKNEGRFVILVSYRFIKNQPLNIQQINNQGSAYFAFKKKNGSRSETVQKIAHQFNKLRRN